MGGLLYIMHFYLYYTSFFIQFKLKMTCYIFKYDHETVYINKIYIRNWFCRRIFRFGNSDWAYTLSEPREHHSGGHCWVNYMGTFGSRCFNGDYSAHLRC